MLRRIAVQHAGLVVNQRGSDESCSTARMFREGTKEQDWSFTVMEENLRRAALIARGDPTVFVTRPISAGFLIASVLLLIIMILAAVRKKREEACSKPAQP